MSNTTFDSLTHKMERAAAGKLIDVALSHVNQDRQKAMVQMVDFAKQFYGDSFSEETYDHARLVLGNPDSKWSKLINCVLDQTNPNVARTTALNLGYEAFFRGTKTIRENRVKYQCNIPWLILFDPTSACNMHCVGCWAGEYGHKNNLSFADMDKIITQGKELGVYLYMLTGGEPLVSRRIIPLIRDIRAIPQIEDISLTTNGALLPKLAALVSIMPQSVLGGAAVMMFSSIVMSGIQLITREPLTPRSLSIVSVALGLGYGIGANNGILAHAPQMISLVFGGSGIVPAALVAILLNLAIPKDENG